jgi:hypothetical protein
MTEHTETLPIAEVAQLLHTTPLNVLMHIKRGLLQGSEGEGGWQIERASLESFLAATGGVKEPGVCTAGCAAKHACGGGCG